MSADGTTRAATQPATLSGAEKVAILLLALGKGRAAKLLQKFDAEDLRLLSRSVTDLRPVSAADFEGLVEEFGQKFSTGVNFVGTANEFRDLLSGLVPEEPETSATPAEPVFQSNEQVWQQLSRMKLDALRLFLLKEHPQTVAVIVSKIDTDAAAKAISSFPSDYRSSLLCRMLGTRKVPNEIVAALEARLAKDLSAPTGSGSHGSIADILNRLDKKQSDAVLQSLAEVRPGDAKALKSLMFSFEDLATLSPAARTTIFDQVPIERLVLALRGTDAVFQAAILSALASRSRRMVEAELQSGSNQPARDIADARRAIVATVLKLIAKGDIQLKATDDIDEITA